MLRLVPPEEHGPEPAYRVPWHVERGNAPVYVITNGSRERVEAVRFQFVESILAGSGLCGSVEPGESIIINAARIYPDHVAVTLCWFRPDGREYAWTFSD